MLKVLHFTSNPNLLFFCVLKIFLVKNEILCFLHLEWSHLLKKKKKKKNGLNQSSNLNLARAIWS